MSTSDVRSIESLRSLHHAIGLLAHDWDGALQQLRRAAERVREHFAVEMPAYWKQQTRAAEQKLTQALDNLSSQQGNSTEGRAPSLSEAKQRVQLARRRLTLCEAKLRAANNIAIHIELACQELAGPLAEVSGQANTSLPNAALKLESLIGHLEQYAELSKPDASDTPSAHPSP
ncbi:MAG: hypothetical protein ACO1RT_21160 [Planctomycetaceae bacterium]